MSRIEDEVCKKIAQRAEVGKAKYGVTMETSPITHLEWLIHAQEEAMDLAVYLQKIIEEESLKLLGFYTADGESLRIVKGEERGTLKLVRGEEE
tara:strand:+ start:23 stop:304 length:282 start_codon:yes stop_codon:yes gene_type:complete